MTFKCGGTFTRINAPRVDALLAKLDQIEKSAGSNKPTAEEYTALVAPVLDRLSALMPPPVMVKSGLVQGDIKPGRVVMVAPIMESPNHLQMAQFVADLPRDRIAGMITHLVHRALEEANL